MPPRRVRYRGRSLAFGEAGRGGGWRGAQVVPELHAFLAAIDERTVVTKF
jgi:hypothetical protein